MKQRLSIIIITLLFIAALALLGAGAYYFFGSGGNGNDKANPDLDATPTPTATVTPTITLSDTETPTSTVAPTSTSQATVKVFFSKNPESNNDFAYDISVSRTTNRTDVGAFTIEQLIAGPSSTEQAQNLFSPLKLTGASNCGTKDFTLSIDSAKKATLKFCKNVDSAGVGTDARVTNTINDTLKQFPTITKVVILTKDDNCFGDMSGQNLCKK